MLKDEYFGHRELMLRETGTDVSITHGSLLPIKQL